MRDHLDADKSVLTALPKTGFLPKADRFSLLVKHRNSKVA